MTSTHRAQEYRRPEAAYIPPQAPVAPPPRVPARRIQVREVQPVTTIVGQPTPVQRDPIMERQESRTRMLDAQSQETFEHTSTTVRIYGAMPQPTPIAPPPVPDPTTGVPRAAIDDGELGIDDLEPDFEDGPGVDHAAKVKKWAAQMLKDLEAAVDPSNHFRATEAERKAMSTGDKVVSVLKAIGWETVDIVGLPVFLGRDLLSLGWHAIASAGATAQRNLP